MARIAAVALSMVAATAPMAHAEPIPESPTPFPPPSFIGEPAHVRPISLGDAPTPPRHPFMASLERIDVDRDGKGCQRVWRSDERAPSVVPKLSLRNGLVYTYTKEPDTTLNDPWYLTAIDFRNGKTVYKQLAGRGVGYNKTTRR